MCFLIMANQGFVFTVALDSKGDISRGNPFVLQDQHHIVLDSSFGQELLKHTKDLHLIHFITINK